MDLSKEEYLRLDRLVRLEATGTQQVLAENFNNKKKKQ
jgi:hypothetical protein